MKRIVLLFLSCVLLLTSCGVAAVDVITEEAAVVAEEISVVQYETFGTKEDGYCLTYPASFKLTESDENSFKFTDHEQDLSISLSIEKNTYSDLSAEEYPEAMGLGMYSKMLSENSFDRDIYVKDDESCYSLYTLTDEYIYCVEYSYQGEPGQDSLIDQLSFEAYGEFSGDDDTETLMSYALVHLADLMGDATGYTLAYKEKSTVNGREMAVFKVCSGDDAICLMAVNADGVCYVDYSATGSEFINIELLLYDTTENTSDKLMYYANYYYEVLYGTKPAEGSIVLDNADHYFGDRHLTVYTASCDLETVLIGISDEGIGFVDRSGTGNEFVKIEN